MGRTNPASLLNRLLQNIARHRGPRPPPPPTTTNAILAHADSGNVTEAITLLSTHNTPLPASTYASLFHHCTSAFPEAQTVLSHLLHFDPSPPTFLLNRAIEALGKCGRLDDARRVFNGMPRRDGGTWNAMIVAYSQVGHAEEVVLLFDDMNYFGIRGNHITFASVLGCCADLLALFLVRQIHGLLVRFGFCGNVILGSSLVDSYGKCLCMREARLAFEDIPIPNAVSWNVIVRRYLEVGSAEDAVFMFFRMLKEGVGPLNFTVSNALKACAVMSGLQEGKQIHGITVKIGLEDDDEVVGNSLIEMYAKCGFLDDARRLFDQHGSTNVVSWTSMISLYLSNSRIDCAEKLFSDMPQRNVVSWNAMLAGYVHSSRWEDALDFIFWMRQETEEINHITLGMILNLCGGLFDLEKGKQVHGFAYRRGYLSTGSVGNAILDMYGKCGSLRAAELCFHQIGCHRNRASWNTLIRCFTCHQRSELALLAFREMQQEATPNEFTFSVALAACANIFSLNCGKQIHGYMVTNGYRQDAVLSAALVDMYSKCRYLEYAAHVFEGEDCRDIIMWNSIILGCAYNGYGRDALDLFQHMEKEGTKADNVTISGILLACTCDGFVDLGLQYFNSMTKKYGVIPLIEHYDSVIDLLGKHGFMDKLEDFIHAMPFDPTIPMWTKIFNYCREHGNSNLGEESAMKINESNPQHSVQFAIT